MNKEDVPKVLLIGLILGVTAGMVVWFLERFETNRLVEELREHLDERSDEFRAWIEHGRPS